MAWNLLFRPSDGAFDIAAIRSYLDAQPDIVADPHGTDYYIICGLPELVQSRWEARMEDSSRFPRACLVRLSPEQVTLLQESANSHELRSALAFAQWLWEHSDSRVLDSYGVDVTERCQADGVAALYPDAVRTLPVPWANKLIKVGFFRELDHGDIGAPSLSESRSDMPVPEEGRIATYLDAGHLYVASSDTTNDWFADDPDVEIGPPHILTDGTYAWPADLSYYLRNYHARLPRHFVLHIQRNNFQVPGNVDLESLKLE